jgi:hypothetical protein
MSLGEKYREKPITRMYPTPFQTLSVSSRLLALSRTTDEAPLASVWLGQTQQLSPLGVRATGMDQNGGTRGSDGSPALWPQNLSTATGRDPDCATATNVARNPATKNRFGGVNLNTGEVFTMREQLQPFRCVANSGRCPLQAATIDPNL